MSQDNQGIQVVGASCSPKDFPPSSTIDGDEKTCWITTGMYPHEITYSVPQKPMTKIRTVTMGIKTMEVYWSDRLSPSAFVKISEITTPQLENSPSQTQQITHSFSHITPKFIKIVIKEGFSPFAGIRHVDFSQV